MCTVRRTPRHEEEDYSRISQLHERSSKTLLISKGKRYCMYQQSQQHLANIRRDAAHRAKRWGGTRNIEQLSVAAQGKIIREHEMRDRRYGQHGAYDGHFSLLTTRGHCMYRQV